MSPLNFNQIKKSSDAAKNSNGGRKGDYGLSLKEFHAKKLKESKERKAKIDQDKAKRKLEKENRKKERESNKNTSEEIKNNPPKISTENESQEDVQLKFEEFKTNKESIL